LKSDLQLSTDEVDFLLSPEAIRARAATLFQRTVDGKGKFTYHADQLKPTVDFVLSIVKKNYPDLKIPFHSRWGHFAVGGIDRKAQLAEKIKSFDARERARVQLDLVITSVLLDAGAGVNWKYHEQSSNRSFGRSEGLGVASFYLFLSGAMSADRRSLRADREGLERLSLNELLTAFQVKPENPLVSPEGRLRLLNNLATAMSNKAMFKDGRPGNILDYLIEKYGSKIPAKGILRAVLDGFGSIWPGRLKAGKVNLGDTWFHAGLGAEGKIDSLVPFHKLSQWMTYSLMEPILEAGLEVIGVEELTGLAEYRNGGLLIDGGLVSAGNSSDLAKTWAPDSEFIIEWRALTIHLLDIIGHQVQTQLGKTPQEFPLAKVLEGGTWWAGRALAAEKRAGGGPPIQLESDGTVF
jgi:hypothetical protein